MGGMALAHQVELHGRSVANVVETQARTYVNCEEKGNSTLSCTRILSFYCGFQGIDAFLVSWQSDIQMYLRQIPITFAPITRAYRRQHILLPNVSTCPAWMT